MTEGALANYVANSDPDGIDHGLEQRPLMAFAMCYIAAHYVLDLIDEQQAESITQLLRRDGRGVTKERRIDCLDLGQPPTSLPISSIYFLAKA